MALELEDGKYLAFLATIDEEEKPHIYPIILIVLSKKIYFITMDNSSKTKEISMNPCVEILKPDEKNGKLSYLKIEGEAFRIFEKSTIENVLSESQYSFHDGPKLLQRKQLLTFELLPTEVEQLGHREMVTDNNTREWFNDNA
jgi:general stress protein 26